MNIALSLNQYLSFASDQIQNGNGHDKIRIDLSSVGLSSYFENVTEEVETQLCARAIL